ncbi:Uncharacterized protein PHSC3_001410 [Chlamydiales bacterium STE3]|nr:Uncharacterized protein PHSC3_001410 [Chlamydiales bacterium STE3]
MPDRLPNVDNKNVDTKEFEIPETVFVRDIENRVFQGIVLQVLAHIEGIALLEGNLIDSLLGRNPSENVKGISAEQDMHNHTISIKVEVNICYGLSIPDKAEEIQSKIAEEITKLTGLHVSCVHVVFKNIISEKDAAKKLISSLPQDFDSVKRPDAVEEEYSEEF